MYRESLPVPAGVSVGKIIGRGGCNMKKMYSITQSCHIEVEKETVSAVARE